MSDRIKICPNNPEHDSFIVGVTVRHEWKVDSEGECIEDLGRIEDPDVSEMIQTPWWCTKCNSEAVWANDE